MTLIHGHRVCRCRRCIGHVVGTPAGPIQGRKVTDKEYSEHYKQTMLEERRTRRRYAIFCCCCIVNFIHPLRRSRRESANQRNLDEVRRLRKELEERTRAFRPPIQLSFRIPPHHNSPVPSLEMPDDPNDLLEQRSLALRNDAVNHPMIEFERWIVTSSGRLSKFSSARDAELHAAAADLQLQLGLQTRALRNLTRENWYRQREQAAAEFEIAKLRKPAQSVEFDCGESLSRALGYATGLRTLGSPVHTEECNPQDDRPPDSVVVPPRGVFARDVRSVDIRELHRSSLVRNYHQLVRFIGKDEDTHRASSAHSPALRRPFRRGYVGSSRQ